jgi:hypothetical protein
MVTFIHCIENKKNHTFETDAKFYLNSFKHTNLDLFNSVDIQFLQPTPNDITQETINYFANNNITFTCVPTLSTKQINKAVNYTNVCVTCDYFSNTLTSDYMCWIDLDVVFLQKVNEEFFKPTDKIIITIYPIVNAFSKEDNKFRIDWKYQDFFKPYLPKKYQVENLEHYVHSWFAYGPRTHPFWSEWKNLTYIMLDIVHTKHKDLIHNTNFESLCEEIATSILYAKNPTQFEDIRTMFGNNTLSFREAGIDNEESMLCKENTVLYHYNEIKGLFENNLLKYPYKKTLAKMLASNFNIDQLISSKDMTTKNFLDLYK